MGTAGGLVKASVGAAGRTGDGVSWCGWEDWGWCQLVQLGGLVIVSVGPAGGLGGEC